MATTTTPGYVSNAQLAQQLSDLVDRWNTRENQMLALLSQPAGDVTVTDGAGVDHVVPSYLQLNNDVTAQLDSLTGAVAQAQDLNSQSLSYSNQAAASASAAATSETNAATSATEAANSATSASASASAAASSETNAASSASAASTSETNAAASASAAATSKTDADSDATAAANSAAAAADSAAQAAQSAAGKLAWFGVWDISGGTLPPDPPNPGFYWISGTATISGEVYGDGDALVWGTENAWHHIDNQQVVASVAGLTGTISVAQLQTALNLATVATSGNYGDLSGKPTLGTAASQDVTAFATAAQGAKADTSAQLPAAVTDFTGLVRAGAYQSGNLPTAGVGTEIYYNPSDDTCNVLAYDRGASAYKVLYIKGATIKFAISGTNYVTIDGNGVNLTTGRFSGICKFDVVPNVQSAAANGTYYRMPRIFVQSPDPGGNAFDGDLWIW